MYYAVDSSFTVLLCITMMVLIPMMAVMYGIASLIQRWSQERRADQYIKRVMGE